VEAKTHQERPANQGPPLPTLYSGIIWCRAACYSFFVDFQSPLSGPLREMTFGRFVPFLIIITFVPFLLLPFFSPYLMPGVPGLESEIARSHFCYLTRDEGGRACSSRVVFQFLVFLLALALNCCFLGEGLILLPISPWLPPVPPFPSPIPERLKEKRG